MTPPWNLLTGKIDQIRHWNILHQRTMVVSHHVTSGLGEPKVSHSNTAFWPSVNVFVIPSSVRIWGGSSATTHTKRNETHRDLHPQLCLISDKTNTHQWHRRWCWWWWSHACWRPGTDRWQCLPGRHPLVLEPRSLSENVWSPCRLL